MQNGQLCSLKYDPWYIAMHTKLYRGYSQTYSKNHMNAQRCQSARSLCHSSDTLLTQTHLSKLRNKWQSGGGVFPGSENWKMHQEMLPTLLDSGVQEGVRTVSLHHLAQLSFLLASHSEKPSAHGGPSQTRIYILSVQQLPGKEGASILVVAANSQTWLLAHSEPMTGARRAGYGITLGEPCAPPGLGIGGGAKEQGAPVTHQRRGNGHQARTNPTTLRNTVVVN